MIRFLLLGACMFYYFGGAPVTPYDGNSMLSLLGQDPNSQTFKDFTKFWLLSKDDENRSLGIKVYINPITDKVESITVTGDIVDLSDSKFKKCTAKLPLGITIEDDTSALSDKLGYGVKLPGRNTLKFRSGGMTIEVTYSDLKKGKITYLKFSTEITKPLVVADVVTAAKKQSINDKRRQLEQTTFLTNNAVQKPVDTVVLPPFKKAILDIFKASRESTFSTIKADARTESNFWNYKFTYNTKIKVPGEKYNMLYSFPFVTSQLDIVVVLKESDGYDKSFETLYHHYEKQLTESFPASEGWIGSCLPGKDKTQLPDLEFRNDRYGAVILDHSKNPSGRHILYLRFLLFSD